MIFDTTFDIWRRALAIYLSHFGLALFAPCDAPAGWETALRTWYDKHVRAEALARLLAGHMPMAVEDRIVTGWER